MTTAPARGARSWRREALIGLVIVAGTLLVGLLLLEAMSRFVLPVSPGSRFLTADGAPADVYADATSFVSGIRFRQVSPDFDVEATIGPAGYRNPTASNPAVVFIGDSFTFGQGLGDADTFVALYCKARQLDCANLGRPGTGTVRQVDILERALQQQNWRLAQVKLVMLASVTALFSGNDLIDGLDEDTHDRAARDAAPVATTRRTGTLHQVRDFALAHSNLARVAWFQLAPILKSSVSSAPPQAQVDAALQVVAGQFGRLQQLADRHGFTWQIYLLPPLQDVGAGKDRATYAALARIAPVPLYNLTPYLAVQPRALYFPYDGHLNREGSKRVAAGLAELDAEQNQGPAGRRRP